MLRSGIWEESKKAHVPPAPPSESISQSSATLSAHSQTEMLLPKQAENVNWRGLWAFAMRNLPAAPVSCNSYIFINFQFVKPRKQPYFDKDSAGMEDGEGRLRKEISET